MPQKNEVLLTDTGMFSDICISGNIYILALINISKGCLGLPTARGIYYLVPQHHVRLRDNVEFQLLKKNRQR